MSDPAETLTEEEISSILDGEADEAIVERFRTDPDAQARAAELESASALLRNTLVEPLDSSVVDDLVANALAAMDTAAPGPEGTEEADSESSVETANVIAFAAPPRSARRRGPSPLLVAAAVTVLMGIGLALVWSGTRGTTERTSPELAGRPTTASPEVDAERTPEDAGASNEAPAVTHVPSNLEPVHLDGYLGSFDDIEALRAAADDAAAPLQALPDLGDDDPLTGDISVCAYQIQQLLRGADIAEVPSAAAMAELEGSYHLVLTFPPADGPETERALIVVADGCQPVHQFKPS